MDPDKIELNNLNKIFEYEVLSREIDSCKDVDQLKIIAKSFAKLYYKQEEVISQIGIIK